MFSIAGGVVGISKISTDGTCATAENVGDASCSAVNGKVATALQTIAIGNV